ncbi:DUF3426 domain-containing protein [Lysobacter sp. A3-1-A15]|uniref:DUF3426 domain-containing protein n=1 Tax=Novilysobacter viscosus TaxID=3098602 RepID=UPI002EDABCE0
MFVPCPHCGFLVSLIARGDAHEQRCPRCEQRLEDPTASLEAGAAGQDGGGASTPPETGESTAIGSEGASEAEAGDHEAPAAAAVDATPPAGEAPATSTVDAATTPSPAPPLPRGPRSRGPSFARVTLPGEANTLRWPLRIAAALLLVLLLVQLLLAQRAELGADARWRPWVQTVCGALGCEVPAWHEPAAFRMLDRNVRPKPGTPGVLQVSASFRNDARWAQPWPTLRVALTDVDGREVAASAFTPDQYRSDGDDGGLLAPGQSAAVRLDVREPAQPIVAFTFDFR